MSTFKLKPKKVRHINEVQTLDETHKKIVADFKKKKRLLPNKKQQLEMITQKYEQIENKNRENYTNDDINMRATLKSDIQRLKQEIDDIENNVAEMDYYSKTQELLMDYYDIMDEDDKYIYEEYPELSEAKKSDEDDNNSSILEKLHQQSKKKHKIKKVAKRRKKNEVTAAAGNIMTYLQPEEEVEVVPKKDKQQLLDEFKMLIDNEYIYERCKNYELSKMCDDCDVEKTLIKSDGIHVCPVCGEVEMVIMEAEKPNYKENIPDKPGYPYKRINQWLITV